MKNLKNALLICMIMVLAFSVQAQKNRRGEWREGNRREKIDSAKVAFLTERLNLTSDQSEKFWPLYNQYHNNKRALRREEGGLRSQNGNLTATDEQLKADIDKMLALRQKEVDMDKDYYQQLQKILSIRQIAELYHSERLFTRDLIRNLRGPQGKR